MDSMGHRKNSLISYLTALLVFALPLSYLTCTHNPVILKKPFISLLTLICLIFILLKVFTDKGLRLPGILSSTILLYFIILLFSSFYSGYRYAGVSALERLLLFIALYLVGLYAGRDNLELVFKAISISTAVLSAILIVQYITCGKLTFGAGNPNLLAGYLILIIPLLASELSRRRNLPNLIIFLLTIATLFLTHSRAAWAALFISLPLFFYPYLRKEKRLVKGLSIAFFLIAIFFLAAFSLKTLSTDVRPLIWRGTVGMIKEHPIRGWGIGRYSVYYPGYRIAEYFLHPQAATVTEHAHSEFLEVTAEAGFIGLFAFLSIIAALFWTSKELLKAKETGLSSIGLAVGLIAFLVHNSMSIGMRFILPGGFFWFSLGLLGGISVRSGGSGVDIRRGLTIAFILPLVFLLGVVSFNGFFREVPGEFYLKKALRAKNTGDFKKSITYYNNALTFKPYSLQARYKLAYAYGKSGDDKKAKNEYLTILKLAPDYAKTHYNLGVLYIREGQLGHGEEELKKAYGANPYDVKVLCSLSSIYIQKGNIKDALRFAEKALLLDSENEYAMRIIRDFSAKVR